MSNMIPPWLQYPDPAGTGGAAPLLNDAPGGVPPWVQYPDPSAAPPSAAASSPVPQNVPAGPVAPWDQYPAPAPGRPIAPPQDAPWMRAFGGGGDAAPGTASNPVPALPVAQPPPAAPPKPGKPLSFDQQSQADLAQVQNATAQKQAAIKAEGDLTAQQAQVQADGMARASAANDTAMQQEAARRAQIQQANDSDMADLKSSTEALSKATIDPNHYWNDKSGLDKVGSAIALFLGGFIQPKTGHNPAMEIIQKEIDQDIQAQRDNLANKRATLADKSSLYAMNYKRYGDELAAMSATRVQMLAAVKMQVDAKAAMFDAPIQQAKAQQLGADVAATGAKEVQTFAQQVAENNNQRAQIGIAGANSKLQRDEFNYKKQQDAENRPFVMADWMIGQAAARQKAAQGANETAIFGATDPTTGAPVLAPDKDRAKDANLEVGKAQKAVSALDELVALRSKYGSEISNGLVKTENAKRLDAAYVKTLGLIREQFGPRWTEAEERLLKQQIGDSATSFRDNTASWQEVRSGLVQDMNIYLRKNINPRAVWTPDDLAPEGVNTGAVAHPRAPAPPAPGASPFSGGEVEPRPPLRPLTNYTPPAGSGEMPTYTTSPAITPTRLR